MAKYDKWLGASLGWMLTGNPLVGVLGFIAGSLMGKPPVESSSKTIQGVSEFEVNLMVLATHLIKIDGAASHAEIAFTEKFLNTHFDERFAHERTNLFNHCLHKAYDLNAACGQIRMYAKHETHVQVTRFLIDVAQSDGPMNEREDYFIFRIAGFLNVNDVDYRRIKNEHRQVVVDSVYEILGVSANMSMAEIRTAYRRLVLKYHPDRNKDASEEQRKKLARKFQQIQEAYEKIKLEKQD